LDIKINTLFGRPSATAGLLVNFGHVLSVGLLVRPWPYRRRRPWEVTENEWNDIGEEEEEEDINFAQTV